MRLRASVILALSTMLALSCMTVASRLVVAQTVNVTRPTQVLSGDDLRGFGVVRLTEILSHVGEARLLSLDGFAARFSLSGIGSFDEAPPTVFVDGHPIDYGLTASGDLSLIGLPVEAIDRVEVFARPTLIAGVFAGGGAIHIFTREPEGGPELHVRGGGARIDGQTGAIAGAAGSRTRSEIDAMDFEGAALSSLGDGHALVSIVHRRHARPGSAESRPLTTLTAPLAAFTWAGPRLHVNVLGAGLASDWFPYVPHTSIAPAAEIRGGLWSATAAHGVGERSFLRHRGTINVSRERYGLDAPLWNGDHFHLMSSLVRTLEDRIVVLGATADLRRARAGHVRSHMRWGSVFAAIAGQMAPGTQYRGGGMVAMDGRTVAVKAYGGISVERWEKHRADLNIVVVDGLLYDQNAADFWARQGVTPPHFPADVERPSDDVTIKATFDATWTWRPTPTHELRTGAGIRRAQKVYLLSRTLRPEGGADYRESVAFEYASGTQAVVWGEFATHALPGRQRLFWSLQRVLVGDPSYVRAWDALPDIRAGISASTPIIAGFGFSGMAVYRSRTKWQDVRHIPMIRADLPARVIVDVFATKRLLSGLVYASIGVQNALGADVHYHPFGDGIGRSIRAALRLDLTRRR